VDTNNGHIEILGSAILDTPTNTAPSGYKDLAKKFFELEQSKG
jgi:hypothetical protein